MFGAKFGVTLKPQGYATDYSKVIEVSIPALCESPHVNKSDSSPPGPEESTIQLSRK